MLRGVVLYLPSLFFIQTLCLLLLQTKHDHRKIIYMNLKATKMSEYKFFFDKDIVDYYVNFQDANGWASTAMRIYEHVADEYDYDGETDMRALYLDLLTQVEDKIRKIWN